MRADAPPSPLIHPSDLLGPRGFQWGVLALEYYASVLNRRTIAAIAGNHLVLFVAGPAVMAIRHNACRIDPRWWLSPEGTRSYAGMSADSDALLRVHRRNRRIPLTSRIELRLDPRRKWGMGSVPHSGRLSITTDEETRELILLGKYDAEQVLRRFERAIEKAREAARLPVAGAR